MPLTKSSRRRARLKPHPAAILPSSHSCLALFSTAINQSAYLCCIPCPVVAGTNFLNVALHELGHSLGLAHSAIPDAVMFPWYQNNEVAGNLPDDDRFGIQQLYGTKEKTWGPYKPQTTTTTTTTTTMRAMIYRADKPAYWPWNNPSNNPNNDRNRARERHEEERRRQEKERRRQEEERRHQEEERRRQLEERQRQEEERWRQEQERQEEENRRREIEHKSQWERNPSKERNRPRERQEMERRRQEQERQEQERQEQEDRRRERERDRQLEWERRNRNGAREPVTPTANTTPRPTNKPYPTVHRQHHHHNKPRKPKPDSCMTYYDAISIIRGELFIFRGPVSFSTRNPCTLPTITYESCSTVLVAHWNFWSV